MLILTDMGMRHWFSRKVCLPANATWHAQQRLISTAGFMYYIAQA